MGSIREALNKKRQKNYEKWHKKNQQRVDTKGLKAFVDSIKKTPTINKGMAKKKLLEQTPTGMANKTGSDAVIPEGHAQRKCKLYNIY